MIAHVDIDAFFASVAQREDPTLVGKAIAVSGSSRRAVILTASYEARVFGIRSAMPLYLALERCPHLLVVKPQGELYREASRQIFALLAATGYPFESLSIDEGYLDLHDLDFPAAIARVQELRAAIYAQTQLTVSAGLGTSKLIAKIASDYGKPNGLHAIAAGDEAAFLHPLPVDRLPGVGPKLRAQLHEHGLQTIGEIARLPPEVAVQLFGRGAAEFVARANGLDARLVEPVHVRKSLSTESTFEYNLQGEAAVRAQLYEQAQEISDELRKRGLRASVIGIKIKRPDFRISGRQTKLREPANDVRILFAAARHCWRTSNFAATPIRLLGLRVSDLTADGTRQLPLFGPRTPGEANEI